MLDNKATDNYWFMAAVLIALALFAASALILPTFEEKTTVKYQALLFVYTLSGVVLLCFAGSLIVSGFKRLFVILGFLREVLRNRPK